MTQIPVATQGTIDGILRAIKDIKQVLLGRITFVDNIQATQTTVIFAAAATDKTINHGLERIPTSFIAHADVATNIYKGSVAWTNKTITLQSSVSATVTLTIF